MNMATTMYVSDEVDFDNLAENVWERCDIEDITDEDMDLEFFSKFLADCWEDNEFDEENDFSCDYDILDWGQELLPIYLDNVDFEEEEEVWISLNDLEKYVNDISEVIEI